MPTIRPMHPSDAPTVVDMITALSAFHNDTADVTVQSLLRDTDPSAPWMYVFVAEDAGTLIGYMALLPLAKIADGRRGIDINHIYVAESYRGQGVGRALLAQAEAHAKSLGCRYMFISTAPQNTAAQDAYRACGFADFPQSGGPRFRKLLDV